MVITDHPPAPLSADTADDTSAEASTDDSDAA
jgi:hypothetical protein